MTDKYLVYVTASRASVYLSRGNALSLVQHFANDEDGYGNFAAYLQSIKHGMAYILADIVEEDFHIESIPFVRGEDRRQLVSRRLAQRYRDTSLSLAMSLGTEKTQRRDERLLLSSFTNTQIFQPWLNALRQTDIALAGVYSPALLAETLASRLGHRNGKVLIVTLQPAGLRQSLVEDGKIRFSRLGPLDPAEAEQPTRVAAAFAGETVRIHQYLSAVRLLGRDDPALNVVLIAPPGRRALVQAAASDTAQLRFTVVDFNDAAAKLSLRGPLTGLGAEALYLQLVAHHPPSSQYLGEQYREGFRVNQISRGMLAGGVFALSLCAVFALFRWWTIYDVRAQTDELRSQVRALTDTYDRVTAGFPKIPTTVDNLKLTLQQYDALNRQIASPEAMLREVAAVLAEQPRVQLDTLKWEQGVAAAKFAGGGPKPAATSIAPINPGTAAPNSAVAGAGGVFEVLELSARITGIAANDYRQVTNVVNEFVERLRARPGLEVLSRKLPFDIGSETALTGDIGRAPANEAPLFQVTVGRRLAL